MDKRGIAAAAITAALTLGPVPVWATEVTSKLSATPATQVTQAQVEQPDSKEVSSTASSPRDAAGAQKGNAAQVDEASTAVDTAEPDATGSATATESSQDGEKGMSGSAPAIEESADNESSNGATVADAGKTSQGTSDESVDSSGAQSSASESQDAVQSASASTDAAGASQRGSDATESTSDSADGSAAADDAATQAPTIRANAHVQNVGWQGSTSDDSTWQTAQDASGNDVTIGTVGQSLRLEALQLDLSGVSKGGVRYKVHVQNVGWMDWVSDGAVAGTTGQGLRLEALRIELTGGLDSDYSIYYQVHAQDLGWMGWSSDGAMAGTAGLGKRLEALRIRLVRKDGTAPVSTAAPRVVKDALSGQAHVQNVGWQDQRTADSGSHLVLGTTGQALRLEALRVLTNQTSDQGGIRYNAHVQNVGWQSGVDDDASWTANGGVVGTTGQSLRVEALQLELTGDYAKDFDLYYRVHVANYGWLAWTRNGLTAGTVGLQTPVEAVDMMLVPKGTSGYNTSGAAYVDANLIRGLQATITADGKSKGTSRAEVYGDSGYLFLPSFATQDNVKLSFDGTGSWGDVWIGSTPDVSGSWTQLQSDGTSLPTGVVGTAGGHQLYVKTGSHYSASPLVVMSSANLESVFITSDDPVAKGRAYVEGSRDHSTKATGSATVVSAYGEAMYDGALSQIKGRGNATWGYPQKPYQIKLSKKASLLDGSKANKAKTWLLISTYADPSLMCNYISYHMAAALGLAETPDCGFVDLYYDGSYRGTYLLTEKVEINGGRLDIDTIQNGSSVAGESDDDIENHATAQAQNAYGQTYRYVTQVQDPADISGGYLLELDRAYYGPERSWFHTADGSTFVLKDPENASQAEVRYISEFVQNVMNHACDDGKFGQLMDANSAVATWLVQTLAYNADYYQWSSTYFYKKAGDDHLYSGPVWDMNMGYGMHFDSAGYQYRNPSSSLGPSEKVFYCNSKDFRWQARQMYNTQMAGLIDDLTGVASDGQLESIDSIAQKVARSQAMNQVLWGVTNDGNSPTKHSSFSEAVSFLKSWVSQRAGYLSDRLNDSSWC